MPKLKRSTAGAKALIGLWTVSLTAVILVLLLLIFMLLKSEDLRNHLIRLIGQGRISTTTRADAVLQFAKLAPPLAEQRIPPPIAADVAGASGWRAGRQRALRKGPWSG